MIKTWLPSAIRPTGPELEVGRTVVVVVVVRPDRRAVVVVGEASVVGEDSVVAVTVVSGPASSAGRSPTPSTVERVSGGAAAPPEPHAIRLRAATARRGVRRRTRHIEAAQPRGDTSGLAVDTQLVADLGE